MITKVVLDTALLAHGQWKKRLQQVIATGSSDVKPEVAGLEDACDFGKWLNDLTAQEKGSAIYTKVKGLHAEFHKVAGEILKLALEGKTEEARNQLEPGGRFGSAGGKLVLALQDWKNML